jgi:hypothetical protein
MRKIDETGRKKSHFLTSQNNIKAFCGELWQAYDE